MTRVTVDNLLREAQGRLNRLSARQAHSIITNRGGTLIDVRTPDNRQRDGRLHNAIEISLNVLEWRLDPDSPHRHPLGPGLDDLLILMCEQGYSSSLAATRLQQLGFARATDVIGGFEAWKTARLPIIRYAGHG